MSSGLIGGIVSLCCALSSSAAGWQITQLKEASPAFITCLKFLAATVCAGVLLASGGFGGWQASSLIFFILAVCAVPLEYLITYFQTKSYQESEQSLVGPLWGTSTLFALPLGVVFLGEIPTVWGLCGVLIAAGGTMLLGWEAGTANPWSAVLNILRDRGAYYMLTAALCGAIATIIAKYAFMYGSPLLYLLAISVLTGILGVRGAITRDAVASIRGRGLRIAFLTLTSSVLLITHFVGLGLLPAAYFLSIKRSSVVFDVLVGKLLNKDQNFLARLPGALLIFGGVALTLLKG